MREKPLMSRVESSPRRRRFFAGSVANDCVSSTLQPARDRGGESGGHRQAVQVQLQQQVAQHPAAPNQGLDGIGAPLLSRSVGEWLGEQSTTSKHLALKATQIRVGVERAKQAGLLVVLLIVHGDECASDPEQG